MLRTIFFKNIKLSGIESSLVKVVLEQDFNFLLNSRMKEIIGIAYNCNLNI